MARKGLLGAGGMLLLVAAPLGAQTEVTLPGADVPLRDRPAQVWAVGAEEGASWQLLSNVRSAAFDSRDNLYVLDAGNHRVLVFDRDGRYVREIGKQGGGPGEFQFPQHVTITTDDRLVVLEPRGHSVFRPDGTFEGLHPAGVSGMRIGSTRLFAHPRGGIVIQSRPVLDFASPPAEGSTLPAPVVRLDLREGAAPETLFPLSEPAPVVREMPGQGGRTMRMVTTGAPREVFESAPSWAMLADGTIAYHEGAEYRIRLGRDGRETHVLTRPIAPRAPTERDRERAREERREQLGSAPVVAAGGGTFVAVGGGGGGSRMPEDELRKLIDGMTFSERMHVVHGIFADPLGRLWVERAPATWGDEPPVDLIGADGRYIGTVPSLRLPLAVSTTGLAAWVEKDELEVERVVVRRLPGSWR